MSAEKNNTEDRWQLPPVVLHPFETRPEAASLPAEAIGIPSDRDYLEKRFAELRMLCFLGRDLERWLSQCLEMARRQPAMGPVTETSFIALLLFAPPENVTRKLNDWGVGNYQIIFSRALGLNLVYPFPPTAESVSESLLRNFHVYSDALFDLRMKISPGPELEENEFAFEVYASSEYSQTFERDWKEPED